MFPLLRLLEQLKRNLFFFGYTSNKKDFHRKQFCTEKFWWSITAQKMKFSIEDYFSKTANLVTFTEEILNGKLHFLCSVCSFRRNIILQPAKFLSNLPEHLHFQSGTAASGCPSQLHYHKGFLFLQKHIFDFTTKIGNMFDFILHYFDSTCLICWLIICYKLVLLRNFKHFCQTLSSKLFHYVKFKGYII